MSTRELGALLVASACATCILWRARQLRRRFAVLATSPPPATLAALAKHRWLPLRHAIVHDAVAQRKLEEAFDAMCDAFKPQQVDYSNTAYGKDHWKLSCFMEYSNGVAAGRINLAQGGPLKHVCEDILRDCDAVFMRWYDEIHPHLKTATRSMTRLQSFVTRYRRFADETHLPRHIDGANVSGSLVLGLPTYQGFTGGGLTVWDGDGEKEVFEYPMGVGEACLLDTRVWHQSNPVLSGERWVIVIFYEVTTTKPGDPAPGSAQSRSEAVRGLLKTRVLNAARRKAASEQGALQSSAAKEEIVWKG